MVAWIAFAVSCLSLGWQIVSWFNSGPRIVVKSVEELIFGEPDHRRIAVVVMNVGRAATTVQTVGVAPPGAIEGGAKLGQTGVVATEEHPGGLPKRLEAGDELVVKFDGYEIVDMMGNDVKLSELVPYVRSAGRKWTVGKFVEDERRFDVSKHPAL
jgi:hypothetical protein